MNATEEAFGVDPQTARHYLDASKAFDGHELIKRLSLLLMPQKEQNKDE